jgi:hypothetical protein
VGERGGGWVGYSNGSVSHVDDDEPRFRHDPARVEGRRGTTGDLLVPSAQHFHGGRIAKVDDEVSSDPVEQRGLDQVPGGPQAAGRVGERVRLAPPFLGDLVHQYKVGVLGEPLPEDHGLALKAFERPGPQKHSPRERVKLRAERREGQSAGRGGTLMRRRQSRIGSREKKPLLEGHGQGFGARFPLLRLVDGPHVRAVVQI